MDAFEIIVAKLVQKKGYWVIINPKVTLEPEEKNRIGLPSCPRWEFDLVAYKACANEVLVIECKSFVDSKGVRISGGKLMRENRYKLFNIEKIQGVVLGALRRHLLETGMCKEEPVIRLVLAAGKIAPNSRAEINALFKKKGWMLWDENWIGEGLAACAEGGYENDAASLAAKLLYRHLRRDRFVSDGTDVKFVE